MRVQPLLSAERLLDNAAFCFLGYAIGATDPWRVLPWVVGATVLSFVAFFVRMRLS